MPPAKTVAYTASTNAVWGVLEGGFVTLAPGVVDEPVVLREAGPDLMNGADGRAVVLLEMPEDLLSHFERPTENGGPGRAFAVPASIADRFPVLAYRAEGRTTSAGPPRAAEPRTGTPPRAWLRQVLHSPAALGVAVLALVGAGVTLFLLAGDGAGDARQERVSAASAPNTRLAGSADARPDTDAALVRERRSVREERRLAQRSRAVGSPTDGSLLNGVPMPAEGENFFTWNIPRGSSPNPRSRRFGTFTVVQRTRAVIASFRRANPRAPRVGIADLSLPEGGEFGVNFGGTGHVGHRNGTEVDILYPRRDRAEQAAGSPGEVDRRLAQDLLDRFLKAGAVVVVVDARVGLTGPAGKIKTAPFHEDHIHIRFPAR